MTDEVHSKIIEAIISTVKHNCDAILESLQALQAVAEKQIGEDTDLLTLVKNTGWSGYVKGLKDAQKVVEEGTKILTDALQKKV